MSFDIGGRFSAPHNSTIGKSFKGKRGRGLGGIHLLMHGQAIGKTGWDEARGVEQAPTPFCISLLPVSTWAIASLIAVALAWTVRSAVCPARAEFRSDFARFKFKAESVLGQLRPQIAYLSLKRSGLSGIGIGGVQELMQFSRLGAHLVPQLDILIMVFLSEFVELVALLFR